MVFEYKGEIFLTDNDLKVTSLGRYPSTEIQNSELKKYFEGNYGRNFLGGDEIISHRQALVAKGMSFLGLEDDFIKYIEKGQDIEKAVFDKTATGIGRGHSLGGLVGVSFGLSGTKMIDSGLTGLTMSRSITTSGRRRQIKESDIVVPESITKRDDLLDKYLEIAKSAFAESKKFEEKFGKRGGVESFNKALPYNNPGDLFIDLPLDTMATLAFEVEKDELNSRGPFLPREVHSLVKIFPKIAEENGIGVMYNQRIKVPRGTYFHYNVFKDPTNPNHAIDLAAKNGGTPLNPILLGSKIDFSPSLFRGIKNLEKILIDTRRIKDPIELAKAARFCSQAVSELSSEYNQAVSATILDSLSFRVWSEQKRHATLRQDVESIYSAAFRAIKILKPLWSKIDSSYNGENKENLPLDEIEKAMVIDSKLRKNPELVSSYVYHSAKSLLFFDELVEKGIPIRDAAFLIPRNTRTINLEQYDFANLISLELPLRLCETCEPERYETSWKKRELIANAIPEIKGLLDPKCNVGYCTEENFCHHIKDLRQYDKELHDGAKEEMLKKRPIK